MSPQSKRAPKITDFTGVRMERELYERAKRRARARYQTYSEFVRQLIVADLLEKHDESATAAPAPIRKMEPAA